METPSTLSPAQVATAMVAQGVYKHNTRIDKVFFKAIFAGVLLSFGGLLNIILTGGSPGLTASNPGLVKILGGFVFPIGLVMIVLMGLELLTSNMMVFPIAVYKRAIPWWSLPLNWLVVTFGNLVGSLFFAAIIVKYSGIISTPPWDTYIAEFAITKAAKPQWHQIFLRGIGCNWLVSIAVWQAAGAKETISKVIAIWLPIWLFVACSFDHVVANMFFIPLGILFHTDLTVAAYIRKSFIAAYLGNIVGALFVAIPAIYFYLSDPSADALHGAEQGNVLTEKRGNGASSPSSQGKPSE